MGQNLWLILSLVLVIFYGFIYYYFGITGLATAIVIVIVSFALFSSGLNFYITSEQNPRENSAIGFNPGYEQNPGEAKITWHS